LRCEIISCTPRARVDNISLEMASEPPALSRDKLHQDLEEHDRFPVFTSSAVKLPDQKDKTGILGKIKTLTARKSSSDSTGSMSISRSSRREAPIELEHPEFEMTYCMMLGIRTVLGTTHAKPLRILGIQDFIDCVKHRFPARGSKETPAHKMRDFKFKDYHPEVFRHIRQRFGIDAADYTLTVTNYHYLEFVSNSKSGQFFFFTHDTQFLIKTMSKVECKFLRKILPQYYAVGSCFLVQPLTFVIVRHGQSQYSPNQILWNPSSQNAKCQNRSLHDYGLSILH